MIQLCFILQTAETFMKHMYHRTRNPELYASYAFDSIWAAALLFQGSLSTRYRPENVTFGDLLTRNAYASLLSQTQFEGLTVMKYLLLAHYQTADIYNTFSRPNFFDKFHMSNVF